MAKKTVKVPKYNGSGFTLIDVPGGKVCVSLNGQPAEREKKASATSKSEKYTVRGASQAELEMLFKKGNKAVWIDGETDAEIDENA